MGLFDGGSNQLQQRAAFLASQTFVVLAISVSKDNEKTPQSAEQFFASLHGIYRNSPIEQEHIGFEIVAKKDAITFYVFTPLHLRDFIEGQLYAQYPDLQINQVSDYTASVNLDGQHVATTNITLTKADVYPIKLFSASEVDPLAGITAVLSGLEENEQVWLQIVVRPIGDEWQSKGVKYVNEVRKTGKEPGVIQSGLSAKVGRGALRLVKEIIQPGSGSEETKKEEVKLSSPQEAALKGIEAKITKLGFETVFRIVAVSASELQAKARLQSLLAALKQFNTTNLNGFGGGEIKLDNYVAWEKYLTREFEEKGNILNIEELASIYHFPSKTVETSAISWAGSKKGEAPFNLPLKSKVDPANLTVLGKTDFRSSSAEFGIKMDDRMRHIYVIGKSGTGKSTLLENMVIDDINAGRGVIIVDPHGELADKAASAIPESRIKDVIMFQPADRDFPVAFNILDIQHEDKRGNIASGFVADLKKIFGNSWGPRLEYILRNATLAILEAENPTMLGIPRMLTDVSYRNQVIPQIKDPVVLDFWKNEWAAKEQKQQVEEMGSILNKVGQFLSSSLIRNIVGQPESGFDLREVMDQKKIFIANLSKGKIGEDNSALLGTLLIAKVQLAAMSRADVDPSQRPECFLYVDEFQNFATESFATILSEARKYNLGLTIAHQYIAQMAPEVKDAVFGNVGSMISFRVGADDASSLKPEFAPVFDENDLVNLQRGSVYIKLLIDGLAVPAFSAQTFPPKKIEESNFDKVVEYSRTSYAKTKDEAVAIIDETAGYRKRREADQAKQAAQKSLEQGNAQIGLRSAQPTANQERPSAAKPIADSQFVVSAVKSTEEYNPKPKPVVPTVAVQQPKTTEQEWPSALVAPENIEETPPLQVSEQKPNRQEEQLESNPKPTEGEGESVVVERVSKPLRVMQGWAYKEVAQRGGLKWYLGESERSYLERLEEKKQQKTLENVTADSPAFILPTEQRANIQPLTVEVAISANQHAVVNQKEQQQPAFKSGSVSLKEGESVKLL